MEIRETYLVKHLFRKGQKKLCPFVLKDQSWNNLSMVEGYAISVVISYACRERK
jgi:hypothetical protein